MFYVNVYEVDRAYGGPEEGGWWYDSGECIHTETYSSKEDALAAQDVLAEKYPRTGCRYSVLYGEDYDVFIESAPGTFFPLEIPYYE